VRGKGINGGKQLGTAFCRARGGVGFAMWEAEELGDGPVEGHKRTLVTLCETIRDETHEKRDSQRDLALEEQDMTEERHGERRGHGMREVRRLEVHSGNLEPFNRAFARKRRVFVSVLVPSYM